MVEIKLFDKEFQAAIQKAKKDLGDLTIPFTLMTQSWFKSNRAIFSLGGPGKYADLSESYKPVKAKKWGFTYPILKASGALANSITVPGDTNSIAQIINKRTLILGSKIEYGKHHQFGTNKMPARPWILMGAEQTAPEEINRRREAWIAMLTDFINQKTAPFASGGA